MHGVSLGDVSTLRHANTAPPDATPLRHANHHATPPAVRLGASPRIIEVIEEATATTTIFSVICTEATGIQACVGMCSSIFWGV